MVFSVENYTKIQINKFRTIQLGGSGVLNGEIYKGPNLRIGDTQLFYTQRTNKAGYTVHKRLNTIQKTDRALCT